MSEKPPPEIPISPLVRVAVTGERRCATLVFKFRVPQSLLSVLLLLVDIKGDECVKKIKGNGEGCRG